MVTCLTEDSCDNPWVMELLAFETPRVKRLFPGWEKKDVFALIGTSVMAGVTVGSARGVLLSLWRGDDTLHVYTVFGERGFLEDVLRVWRELFPRVKVVGKRRGRVRLFSLEQLDRGQ